MEKVKIALLGLGNVGSGVWKIFNTNKNEVSRRSGCEVEIAKVLVRDKFKQRKVDVPPDMLTTNPDDIFKDESIKIVAELIGGIDPAKEYILRAMRSKKHVVTANKMLLATSGEELFKTAEEEDVYFYYEASVGGGIPIIREINESLTANKIMEIVGILNGTTNYILSKMSKEHMDFKAALDEAKEKGYAEADPTSDIEGYDPVYKLAIIASLSFGAKITVDDIYREGITKITPLDIKYACKFGYTIKLLSIGKVCPDGIELRVHPTMIPKAHPLSNVNDSFNAIYINGNAVGELMLYGKGAGDLPTGSAVVSDIISILRNNGSQYICTSLKNHMPHKKIKPLKENISQYYIRLSVIDMPGVLGEISTILGRNNVSILTVTQDVKSKHDVSLIFITHEAKEGDMQKSIDNIKKLTCINKVESIIRIENFNE
jgi:homoserine dehydrogenase